MHEFLSKYAQKAYKEIAQITEKPDFLFSNDPLLVDIEARYNYRYIHGFTRLLKKGSIAVEDVIRSLYFVESKVEEYLRTFYKNKEFILLIYGDIGIPAFTLTLASYHKTNKYEDSLELHELVRWFHLNALYKGLEIQEETQLENESEDFIFKRYYTKIINT